MQTLKVVWQFLFPPFDWIFLVTPNLPDLPLKKFTGNSHDRRIGFRTYRRAFYMEFYRIVWGGRWTRLFNPPHIMIFSNELCIILTSLTILVAVYSQFENNLEEI